MRASPLIFSLAIATGLVACQPAQQADTAAPAAAAAPTETPPAAVAPPSLDAQAQAAPAFRATGNEPGWLAQVSAGENPVLHVETGFGEQKFDVMSPTQGKDGWSGKAADGTDIKVTFQRTVCHDDMSGQAFGATVMLTVGTRQYHGCGDFAGAPALAERP